LDDCTYWHLIHTARDYRQYSAIADLHTLQFTVTHALGFSVFISRVLATDLSHMKSSWHRLIPSCNLFPITIDCHLQNSTQFSSDYCCIHRKRLSSFLYNPSARTSWKTPSSIVKEAYLLVRYPAMDALLLWRARVLRECLPTRCLAMDIHVTILPNERKSNALYNFASHCCSNKLRRTNNVGTQHEPRNWDG
jgi:hypothetical protein